MNAGVYYTVVYGPGEGSDTLEWEVRLTTEEKAAYMAAIQEGTPLEEVSELDDALSRAYAEIEEAEIDNACSMQDGYALDCREKGESPFDRGWTLDVSWADPNDDEYEDDEEEYTFTIHLSNGGDSEVDFPITPDKMELIDDALENGYIFEDVEELSDLYDRVMEAAREQLEDDTADEDIDIEDLEYSISF